MPRGGKKAEVAVESSSVRERNQSAVGETDKDVGLVTPFKMLKICDFIVAR